MPCRRVCFLLCDLRARSSRIFAVKLEPLRAPGSRKDRKGCRRMRNPGHPFFLLPRNLCLDNATVALIPAITSRPWFQENL
jgi:hypothetical protein